MPVIKTALCVEAREGIIYVFLPPMDYLEHYLDLVASIEATAEKLKCPCALKDMNHPGITGWNDWLFLRIRA